MVIKPLLRTQKEINGIIVNIDNKKGDLTQRVTPINNAEVDAVGKGINVLYDKAAGVYSRLLSPTRPGWRGLLMMCVRVFRQATAVCPIFRL